MKAKTLILGILVIFITNTISSQDIIVKKDKSEIKAKIIEIQESLIKYNLFDFPNESPRTISLSNVFMVIHESGRRETFGDVKEEKPVQSVIQNTESVNQPQYQEAQTNNYYPLRLFGRLSGQIWHEEGLSDFFGTNALFGAGIEKQVSDHFKFGGDLDFASKTKDGATLNYTQFGGFVKFSWGFFGGESILFYSQLGIKGISLNALEDSYSEKASGIGFSALIGLEIPLSRKVTLNLGWDSVFGNVDYDGEKLNVGNETFSAGLLFNLR